MDSSWSIDIFLSRLISKVYSFSVDNQDCGPRTLLPQGPGSLLKLDLC